MNADRTWLETADAGWAPVDMPAEVMEDSFVSGDRSGRRLTLRYYTHDDGSMMAKVLLGPGAQGPPGHAHGGRCDLGGCGQRAHRQRDRPQWSPHHGSG